MNSLCVSAPLLGILILLMTSCSAHVTQVKESTHPFESNGSVKVTALQGSITVTGWDNPLLWLQETKKSSKRDNDRLQTHVTVAKHTASISTRDTAQKGRFFGLFNWSWGSSPTIDYQLKVPYDTQLTLETTNGSITVSILHKPIHACAQNGSLTFDNVQDSIIAKTTNGSLHFTQCPGPFMVSTTNGSIKLYGSEKSCVAETVNGSIKLEQKLFVLGTTLELSTVNGSIDLLLPKNTRAPIRTTTIQGKVTIDPAHVQESSHPTITLKTTTGSITVR